MKNVFILKVCLMSFAFSGNWINGFSDEKGKQSQYKNTVHPKSEDDEFEDLSHDLNGSTHLKKQKLDIPLPSKTKNKKNKKKSNAILIQPIEQHNVDYKKLYKILFSHSSNQNYDPIKGKTINKKSRQLKMPFRPIIYNTF